MKARVVVNCQRLELVVIRQSAALENQQASAGAAQLRKDNWFIFGSPLEITHTQRQMLSQAAIDLHTPARAARIAQRISDYIHVLARAIDDGASVQRISRHDAPGKVRVRVDCQCRVIRQVVVVIQVLNLKVSRLKRTSIEKHSDPSADDGAIVFERMKENRDPRRDVAVMRNSIAIQTETRIDRQVFVDCPTILSE